MHSTDEGQFQNGNNQPTTTDYTTGRTSKMPDSHEEYLRRQKHMMHDLSTSSSSSSEEHGSAGKTKNADLQQRMMKKLRKIEQKSDSTEKHLTDSQEQWQRVLQEIQHSKLKREYLDPMLEPQRFRSEEMQSNEDLYTTASSSPQHTWFTMKSRKYSTQNPLQVQQQTPMKKKQNSSEEQQERTTKIQGSYSNRDSSEEQQRNMKKKQQTYGAQQERTTKKQKQYPDDSLSLEQQQRATKKKQYEYQSKDKQQIENSSFEILYADKTSVQHEDTDVKGRLKNNQQRPRGLRNVASSESSEQVGAANTIIRSS